MTQWLDFVAAWLEQRVGITADVGSKIFGTLVVLLVYGVVRRVALKIANRTVEEASSRYQVSKATGYLFGALAVLAIVKIWVQGVTGLATYLGLLSAGLAIALQDPIINLFGWIFIVTRSPFRVGDRIQIGPHAGDVVDIRIFQFTLLEIGNWVHADQSTGRVIHVPNGWVFKNTVANYDRGFSYIWNEIEVVVTFESNWKRAKRELTRIVNDHAEHLTSDAMRAIDEAAERYHIKMSKLTPVVWTDVVDSGVRLTMRYLCKPRDRRASRNEMWEAILEEIVTLDDIDLAYPTTRRVDNRYEGKAHFVTMSMLPPAPSSLPPGQPSGDKPKTDPDKP
jgi:small-conductance mechanosensitive channel